MLALATRTIASAASCSSMPKGSATDRRTAASASSGLRVILPPASQVPSRPSTTLASVLVATSLPLR